MDSGNCGHVDCQEAARRLFAYLDGELPAAEAEAVQQHLTHCGPCLSLSERQRAFLGLVGETDTPQGAIEALLAKVRARLHEERQAR